MENNDLADSLLAAIFGPGWQTLMTGADSIAGATGVLFTLLGLLNGVAMAGVAVMIFYAALVGAVGTAHEGEPLGKRYSTLWAPLRSAFSVAALAPLPWAGGLSLAQAAILAVVAAGAGLGNKLWAEAVDFMAVEGGAVVASPPPAIAGNGLLVGAQIIESEVLELYTAANAGLVAPAPIYESAARPDDTIEYTFLPPSGGPDLGRIILPCPGGECAGAQAAVDGLISDLWPVSQALMRDGDAPTPITTGVNAIRRYTSAITAAAQKAQADGDAGYRAQLDAYAAEAGGRGWIAAGAWYWATGGINQRALDIAGALPAPRDADRARVEGLLEDYDAERAGVLVYLDRLRAEVRGVDDDAGADARALAGALASDSAEGSLAGARHWTQSILQPVALDALTKALTEGDVLANLRGIGHSMISSAWTAAAVWAGARATSAAADAATDAASGIPFVGALMAPVRALASGAASIIGAIGAGVAVVLLPVFLVALALAFYLPALPLILWLGGVWSWLVAVVEAIIAAPLWMAGHAVPDGDGMAGPIGKAGYLILLNIVLRPALMVVALFVAFAGVNLLGRIIGYATGVFVSAAQGGATMGPVSVAAWFVIVASLCIAAIHRLFGLINQVPDQILRWIGEHGPYGGDDGEVRVGRAAQTVAASTPRPRLPGGGASAASAGGPAALSRPQASAADLSPGARG